MQAASPDEEALVQGAAMLGFKLLSRSIDQVSQPVHQCSMSVMSCQVTAFAKNFWDLSCLSGAFAMNVCMPLLEMATLVKHMR